MSDTGKYTFFTFFLALFFVFGSMTGMRLLLWAREEQLLAEGGVLVETPVRTWHLEREEEQTGNSAEESYVLTIQQIEDVIDCWSQKPGLMLHSPVEGQISMEEAIISGKEWLSGMGIQVQENCVTATLSVPRSKDSVDVLLEPYYSFWIVEFNGQSVSACLNINAVTGTIWSAVVNEYDTEIREIPMERLKLFAELSGLQSYDEEIKDLEGTEGILHINDSRLYAKLKFQHLQWQEGKEGPDGNLIISQRNCARMFFDLTLSQSY